jgi:hypothetical protein
MIQVCDPPRVRPVRRFSAEEFCFLLRGEAGSLYRPRSEVLRMLTVGEVCGVCDAAGAPAGAVLLQPLNADTALAAALRAWAGWRGVEGGQFLTPPVLHQPDAADPLDVLSKLGGFDIAGLCAVSRCARCFQPIAPAAKTAVVTTGFNGWWLLSGLGGDIHYTARRVAIQGREGATQHFHILHTA